MKSGYSLHERLFVMLLLSLIFIATIPIGSGFYNRKKTHLETIYFKRGFSEWEGASASGDHPENKNPSDNTNFNRVKVTNGYSITKVLRRKKKRIAFSSTGSTRSKQARGRVKSFCVFNSKS